MSEVRNVNVGSGSGGKNGHREGQQGKPQAKRDYRKGVKKRKYTLEMKQEMLEMIKNGARTRTCEIMRRFNCPESTIRSLKKNKKALTASVNVFSRFSSNKTFSETSQQYLLLVITEHHFTIAQKKRVNSPPPFNASVGWLAAFKKHYEVKFAHYYGESTSDDVAAAEKYLAVFQAFVKVSGYCRDQSFNCDKTGIFWKRSPKTTFTAKDEKQTRGVKTLKDRITVLFTANASRDFLMKHLAVNRAARPRAYRHANKSQLNVYWTSNKKA
ncbi:Tigger transposable element-derived protein 2-like 1 [Homarus americanus]|uniref:Tigger transposable element-derived protein 2-like 1 n=1 Tax=Homarus americanus TaxID=6706 RepID=A0A8J5TKU1_HOMAM|nr:Tigger transposable element-derived protein 2-like 1 [Homarus americanus]